MASSAPRTIVTGGTGFLGRNLVEALRATDREVLVVGRNHPDPEIPGADFAAVDILDPDKLTSVFREFAPREVVHLAAQTDFVTWDDPTGYRTNTEGTKNVLQACAASNADRMLIASSHVVLRPEQSGQMEWNYASSKLAMESIVKQSDPTNVNWTIIRPCSIWGPWFRAPFLGFFSSIAKGRYFDLGRVDPPKRLGFVGNTCFQIQSLLEAPAQGVRGRTFYLADYETTTIRTWARMIAKEFGVHAPKTVPEPVVLAGARVGDLVQRLGYRNPPLTSFRLANMRTDTSVIPVDDIQSLVTNLPFTLKQGVKLTVDWLRRTGLA